MLGHLRSVAGEVAAKATSVLNEYSESPIDEPEVIFLVVFSRYSPTIIFVFLNAA